jgi:transcriptional regulator with XRE-family HTH domain
MATTIQDRMRYLCERAALSPEKLSLRAGLSFRFIRRILTDPKRTSLSARAAENLSYVTGVSRSWIVSGVGAPDETDVPKLPPITDRPFTLEHTQEWNKVVMKAIEIDPKLDWAIMGVGEEPPRANDLTPYALLAEAERFRNSQPSYEERKRLDQKARRFRKLYMSSPSTKSEPQTEERRRSVPPKG